MTSAVPAGWYPDPAAGSALRYWDGLAWTGYVAPQAGIGRREDWPPLPFPGVRAGFGRRALGLVVDSLLVWLPLMAAFFGILFTVLARDMTPEAEPIGKLFVVMMVLQGFMILLPLLYKGLLVANGRRTVGHRVAGIQVVDAATGTGIPLGRALLRSLVGGMGSGQLFGLGYWWALWDAEHRTWHDMVARTAVIDTRDQPPSGIR